MSVYAWPGTPAFSPSQADLWLENTDIVERSVLGGGQQTTGQPGAHWKMALSFAPAAPTPRLELLGFLRMLNGKEHRVTLWDLRKYGIGNNRGWPSGTINPTGVTVSAAVPQFGITALLTGCGAGKTLLPGDMFGINGQLIENCQLATADTGGAMTVLIPQRLRAAAAAGAPVTLIQPTAKFVLSSVFHGPRVPAMYDAFMVEFEEVFA